MNSLKTNSNILEHALKADARRAALDAEAAEKKIQAEREFSSKLLAEVRTVLRGEFGSIADDLPLKTVIFDHTSYDYCAMAGGVYSVEILSATGKRMGLRAVFVRSLNWKEREVSFFERSFFVKPGLFGIKNLTSLQAAQIIERKF